MPGVEQILNGLKTVSNTWRMLAIFWHIYFAAIAVGLIFGWRPLKRLAGILLLFPLLSVSIIAWISFNPFNGFVYALISILLAYVSFRLPREKVQIAPGWILSAGTIMFIFGWLYPHFLDATSFLPYLYAAPIGLIPCATLSIVIGLGLIFNGLSSRPYSLILGVAGLFYGITGVAQLGVVIDVVLLFGSIVTVLLIFSGNK